eukprot:CAMPEP_0185252278 /NCGR_PEP_ID=MMETSP1359-20130426/1418_1 /TAXON_ID=552665 /ORGANISM="Bigelowiella longifila, Strain CCMP242" /LENGTH=442 /DNA_ID=CAMNT_0027834405 /DNA_START=195 /DNA_END=1523 /DNA_ORIENTATION=-
MAIVWDEQNKRRTIDTREMKKILDALDPRFKGRYTMHDAFEFLVDVLSKQLHDQMKTFPIGAETLRSKTFVMISDACEPLERVKLRNLSKQVWKCLMARHGHSFFTDHTWGQYKRETICHDCRKRVVDFPFFRFLQLSLPEGGNGDNSSETLRIGSVGSCGSTYNRCERSGEKDDIGGQVDLEYLLQHHMVPIKRKKWNCPNCGSTADPMATTQTIWKLPDVLYIRLCRVKQLENKSHLKLNTSVCYSTELDTGVLLQECLNTQEPIGKIRNKNGKSGDLKSNTAAAASEGNDDNKTDKLTLEAIGHSDFAGSQSNDSQSADEGAAATTAAAAATSALNKNKFRAPEEASPSNPYALFSIISHRSNSAERGHYVAHIRNRYNGNWYTHNDKLVRIKTSLDDTYKEVYVLCYARKDLFPDLFCKGRNEELHPTIKDDNVGCLF